MECPFELPVEKERLQNTGTVIDGRIKLYRIKPLLIPYTEEEADYIVQAINSHEKLVKLLKDAQRYIRAKDPKYVEIEQALKESENKL